jgi:hypothetical protein
MDVLQMSNCNISHAGVFLVRKEGILLSFSLLLFPHSKLLLLNLNLYFHAWNNRTILKKENGTLKHDLSRGFHFSNELFMISPKATRTPEDQ